MKDIPQIPESSAAVHPDLRRSLVRMREELQSLLGLRGDGSGAALRAGSATGGSTTVIIDTGGPGGGGGGAPDLTPPPTPTFGDGDAFPGITTVILEWAGIGYPQGNGHKQTVIYGVQREPSNPSLPTFGDAQRIATAPNALTLTSIPSEPNTRWHFWLKFETNDGVESVSPAGGTNGVTVTTGQDVADLLAVLTNQITGSQLYFDLAKPILTLERQLDDAAAGSLLNLAATHREQQARAVAILDQARTLGASITESRNIATAAGEQAVQVNRLLTVSSGVLAAAIDSEQVARIAGDAAEASARLTLAAEVQNPTTGLAATRATLLTNYSTTVDMNTAIASSVVSLTAAFNAADSATLASANAFTYSRATIDGSIASSAATLTASYTAADAVVSAAVSTEASVRASETGHLAAQQTVRLDLNGYVVGYGISGTSGGSAGPTSQFLVRVDQFAIVPPTNYTSETAPVGAALNERWYQPSTRVVRRWDGAAWVAFNSLPFVVQAAPTTVNGVTIPAGVYMDAAYIVNLTATYAQISNLIADQIVATEINAARLTLGDGTIGGRLKSSNYDPGVAGWIIRPDGTAEFSAASIRGQLTASQINANGLTIRNAAGAVLLSAVGNSVKPWVQSLASSGTGVSLVENPSATDNTAQLRTLQAGPNISLKEEGGAVVVAAMSGFQTLVLAADQSVASTTPTLHQVVGLAAPVEADSTYIVRGVLKASSAAETTGIYIGCETPFHAVSGGADTVMQATSRTGLTTAETLSAQTKQGGGLGLYFTSVFANLTTAPSAFDATAASLIEFCAIVRTGSVVGNFQVMFGSEINGSAVTIRAGSFLTIEKAASFTVGSAVTLAAPPAGIGAGYTGSEFASGIRALAVCEFSLNADGTWRVRRTGSGDATGTWLPSGSAANFDALLQVTATSGNGSRSNTAATWMQMATDQKVSVSAFSSGGSGELVTASSTVAVRVRNRITGTVTTLQTLTLSVEAESDYSGGIAP